MSCLLFRIRKPPVSQGLGNLQVARTYSILRMLIINMGNILAHPNSHIASLAPTGKSHGRVIARHRRSIQAMSAPTDNLALGTHKGIYRGRLSTQEYIDPRGKGANYA